MILSDPSFYNLCNMIVNLGDYSRTFMLKCNFNRIDTKAILSKVFLPAPSLSTNSSLTLYVTVQRSYNVIRYFPGPFHKVTALM